MPENKNKKVLEEFVAYCNSHPEQRFWQALRNFMQVATINIVDIDGEASDTYYFEDKFD